MTATLEAALVAAQADLPKVDALGRANYGSYVTLDHLIAKTRPVLNRHGLAMTQYVTVNEHGPVLCSSLVHSSGTRLELGEVPLILDTQNMQKLGASITYARRYAWAAILGISEQEDDDGKFASSGGDGEPPSSTRAAAKPAGVSSPPAGNFTAPTNGDRTPAQAKLLENLFEFLKSKEAASDEAFVAELVKGGAKGTTPKEVIETVPKQAASELISKFQNLKTNIGRAAA